ncbi:PREDICTED: tRNA wybutosine-synthesizing protein 2 homolog [Charadrius vociferus]|uniref:tRNA wybutosine-synthesizing protein 2 homolog n=1 Tax=Charadrius vociferus TaxID=50402 RepID=UPI000521C508|nr:PREDICTED: tRNA wybutosine-synthesizing protein 2 homolog [Charadrius vociferus]
MEARDVPISIPALATELRFAQRLREHLEQEQLLDGRYRLQEVPRGRVALPMLEEKLDQLRLPQEMPCELVQIQDPVPSRAARRRTPAQKLQDELRRLLGESWSEELAHDVPRAWQRHGDLVLLSEDSFRAASWQKLGPVLWETVASALGAQRLARRGRVLPDGMRSPSVTLLLGQDGWVEHVDNGIRYTFDVTKCMFSPGNITEKLRVASLSCSGEVLVDLYAGNKDSGVGFGRAGRQRAVMQLELRDVADRVNLGLIPSSEEGWPVACCVLKKGTGGVLHIHHNVETLPTPAPTQIPVLRAEQGSAGEASLSDGEAQHPTEDSGKERLGARIRPEWQRWAEATAARIQGLLVELHGQPWRTSILHIEAVKSYAPHVHHLVLDLECRPTLPA